jgi:hypothetical protein
MTITDLKPPQARPCWHLHETPQPETCKTCDLYLNGTDNQKIAIAIAAGSTTLAEATQKAKAEGKPLPKVIQVRVIKKGSTLPPGERVIGRATPGGTIKTETPIPGPEIEVAPCRHVGRDLTGYEREKAGLGHTKKWTKCDHPNRIGLAATTSMTGNVWLAQSHATGGAVCPCKGCGPNCPGYSPAGTENPDPPAVD